VGSTEYRGGPGRGAKADLVGRPGAEAASAIEELKAVILALEWEITEQTLEKFHDQVNRLEQLCKAEPAGVVELRILRGLGNHVDRAKADVHPETLNQIFAVFQNLERFTREEMSQAEKNAVAAVDLKSYQNLRVKLGAGRGGGTGGSGGQSLELLKTEGVASTMSADERTEQGVAGEQVQPALAEAHLGGKTDSGASAHWKGQESFKEVEDRLDTFFAEDDSGSDDNIASGAIPPTESFAEEFDSPAAAVAPAGEPAPTGDFVDEVGDRLDEFFAEDFGIAPAPGGGIMEGEIPLDFGDDDAAIQAAGPSLAFDSAAETATGAPAPVQAPLPPRKPDETPIKELKRLVEGVEAQIDQQALERIEEQIRAFGAVCKAEPGLLVLLHLLDASARNIKMLGKKTLPGSVELFKSLYGALEELYANRMPTSGPGFDILASETARYVDLQNKLAVFLIGTLIKREKQMLAERKSAAGFKRQVGLAKVAAAKTAERHEAALAAEREAAARLKQQIVLAQVEKDKAVNELEGLRHEVAKQTQAATSAGLLGKLKKMFGR